MADVPSPVVGPPTSSVARALRKRRRTRSSNLWAPVLFGGLLLAALGWFFLPSGLTLEGELTAVRLTDPDLPPRYIERRQVGLSKQTLDLVLEELAERPVRLKSDLMDVELRGEPRGIEVSVWEMPATQFFRVNPDTDADLRRFRTDRLLDLDRPRQREHEAAARDFFQEWERTSREGTVIHDLLAYRNRLGLNTLVGPLGYHLMADVGDTLYPCVYEGDDGALYYLLPAGTRRFKLIGRQLDDGSTLFPGRYTVRVKEQ